MDRRTERRKVQRDVDTIVANAKKDMNDWIMKLPYAITEAEMKAWQAGYIAGINRIKA